MAPFAATANASIVVLVRDTFFKLLASFSHGKHVFSNKEGEFPSCIVKVRDCDESL